MAGPPQASPPTRQLILSEAEQHQLAVHVRRILPHILREQVAKGS